MHDITTPGPCHNLHPQWQAHFDGFTGAIVFGWVKRRQSDLPQIVSLWHNDVCLVEYLKADEFRADILADGIGDGCYGFKVNVDDIRTNSGQFLLKDAATDDVLAALNYNALTDLDTESLAAHARRLMKADAKEAALECWLALANADAQNADYALACGDAAYALKMEDTAREYWQRAFALAGKCRPAFAIMAISMAPLPTKEQLMEAINRYASCDLRFPEDAGYIRQALSLFFELMLRFDAPEMRIIYKNFLQNYILPFQKQPDPAGARNLFAGKICSYHQTARGLKFIAPVLRCLPPQFHEIVLRDRGEDDGEVLIRYGLQRHRIVYGDDQLLKYSTLVTDSNFIGEIDAKFYGHMRIIVYRHAMDASIPNYKPVNLGLIASEYQITTTPPLIKNSPEVNSCVAKIGFGHKLELVHTGPFHIDAFTYENKIDKQEYRLKLEDELGIKLNVNKPIVLFMVDEMSLRGHIKHAVNKLAPHCTLLLKSFLHPPFPQEKAHKDLIFYSTKEASPNIARFAADFIMCGFDSGSFMSNIMFGLNVIPYYSRKVKEYGIADAQLMDWSRLTFSRRAKILSKRVLHMKWDRYFDLLDTDKILKAIFESEYREWLKVNLPVMQKEVFGAHMLAGCAQKTAEHILRFAADGTLGAEADAIYLKESFFRQ